MGIRTLAGRAKTYLDIADRMPIKPKTIYYHAYRSYIMSCSPFAIFSNLIENEAYGDYEHVWVYGSDEVLEYDTFKRYAGHPRVRFVKFGTLEHIEVLATSEYLITNAGIPSYWQKRKGQIVINTWHGVPLKLLGKDAKDSSGASIGNAQRNFLLSDYLVMPNRYTTEKLFGSYDLRGLFRGHVLDVGSPRVDMVVNTDPSRVRSLLEDKLGESLEGKKVVLYAPTFRSLGGKSINTTEVMARYMSELVERLPEDYVIFFKVHNMLGRFFVGDSIMESRLIFDEIETNELLSATDVLITDYSSIFVDFICTGRPVIFFAYDKEEYLAGRGTYLGMDELPGVECSSVDQVVDCVQSVKQGTFENPNRAFAEETFAYNDDGNATSRVVDVIFGGADCPNPEWLPEVVGSPEPDGKINVLVSLDDRLRMSAVQALYMLLQNLDPNTHRVIIAAHSFHLFLEESERLFPGVQVIFAKLLSDKSWIRKEQDEDFYQGQFDNYFPGMHFDQYYNLKKREGLLDAVISHVFPDIEKHWHFSWHETMDESIVLQNAPGYDSVTIYCRDEETLPVQFAEMGVTMMSPRAIRSDSRHRMTVLMVATFDSSNYALAACAEELVARGHEVIVVSVNPASSNNKVFADLGIDVVSAKMIDDGALNFVDAVIGSSVKPTSLNRLYWLIELHNLVMFCFSNLFTNVSMRVNPQFVFTLGEGKNKEFQEHHLKYNCVAIGNPQYDKLLECRKKDSGTIRSVLVVEQGGYPYGEKGKRQLAETLIRIANDNQDMVFDVKPRYMPGDTAGMIHNVSDHLFDYLGDIPRNLRLLTNQETLEDCITKYDAMITMWSTAHLDAVVLDMPLLLIGGFDSVDVFDVRTRRIEEAYKHLGGTGCLYRFDELSGDISSKFRAVEPAYANVEIYALDSPCANRVVDFLEHVFDTLVVPELRIAESFSCTEQEFYESFGAFKLVAAGSDESVIRRQYLSMLNDQLQEIVYKNRCMGDVLDLSPLEQLYDMDLSGIAVDDMEELGAQVAAAANDSFLLIQKTYFESAEGRAQLEKDVILQDFYLDWLFDEGRYGDIENVPLENLLVPESREYCLALIALNRHQLNKAYDHLFEFMRISQGREVTQLLKCKRLKRSLKPFRSGPLKLVFFRRLFSEENRELVDYVFPQIERVPLAAYDAIRCLNREGKYFECVALCDQTQLLMKAKGRRRSTVSGTMKLYMKKVLYRLIEREREKACEALG